jgi:hypothetical protein
MIACASGLRIWVGRFSRLLRGVGVLAMPDAGRDTMRWVESICKVPPCAGVVRLHVTGVAVGVFIDHRHVMDRVEAMR